MRECKRSGGGLSFGVMAAIAIGACSPQSAETSPSRSQPVSTAGSRAPVSIAGNGGSIAGARALGSAGTPGLVPPPSAAMPIAGMAAASPPLTTPPITMSTMPTMSSMPTAAAAGMGAPPPAGTMTTADCPAPPADATPDQVAALNALNDMRIKTGAGCMRLAPELNKSATAHCNYNAGNASNSMCMAGGHSEVMSCMGFTGADVGSRVKAAGYMGLAGVTEVLTQGGTPAQAVQGWIDTLWHRIPMLDPWTTDMGYGTDTGCRVIDFGRGTLGLPTNVVTVYPYDGQTGVATSFNGLESPEPPMPSTGWPSGSFVSVYAQNIKVTDHQLTKDGDPTPIDHIYMDKSSPNVPAGYGGYLTIIAFMYANKPLEPNTKYHAKITGTHTGGDMNLEWSFTTGAASRF